MKACAALECRRIAMLVACRLACLSALEGHYAGVSVSAQFGGACGCAACFFWLSANGAAYRCPSDAAARP